MQKFKYSLLAKIIYRYANIPASLLLFIHLIISIIGIRESFSFILPALINLIMLFILNSFYAKMYKLFPHSIEINNEIMVCSDYFASKKSVEIKLNKIDNISGGIFDGKPMKPIYIHDLVSDETIGINQHMKGFNKLLTIILSNVEQELYEKVLNKMEDLKLNSKTYAYRAKKRKKKPAK